MEVGETLRVETVAEWRDWLQRHHADRREIWLVNDRSGPERRTLAYQEALDEATCFGWVDVLVRRQDEAHFLVRWVPRRPGGRWTAGNLDRVRRLAAQSRLTESGLAVLPPELRAELAGRP